MTADLAHAESPKPLEFLLAWTSIGLQSFGGGAATLALIRRTVVDRKRWVSAAEFTRMWSLSQMTPGINLLAFAILIGRQCAGTIGIPLALCGLLLPSVTVTLLLTAAYSHVHKLPAAQGILHCVIPAVVGIGLATAVEMARPLLRAARSEGWLSLSLTGVLLVASPIAVGLLHAPVLAVLIAAAMVTGLARWLGLGNRARREPA